MENETLEMDPLTSDIDGDVDQIAVEEVEETVETETAETEPAEAEEVEPEEKKDDPVEALKKDYDAKMESAQKEINRLGYALRKAEKPKEDGKESGFTDAQLLAILQEHKDDPTITLQVMKEIVKTGTKDVEANAEKAADIKGKVNEFEKFLEVTYPRVLEDGTPEGQTVDKAVAWLHLDGHPFAKYLAIATMQLNNLPKIIEKVKEDTKKELLGKTVDSKRKESIKANSPSTTTKPDDKKAPALTPEQMTTAKKLFGSDAKLIARYAKMMGGKGGTFTAKE